MKQILGFYGINRANDPDSGLKTIISLISLRQEIIKKYVLKSNSYILKYSNIFHLFILKKLITKWTNTFPKAIRRFNVLSLIVQEIMLTSAIPFYYVSHTISWKEAIQPQRKIYKGKQKNGGQLKVITSTCLKWS